MTVITSFLIPHVAVGREATGQQIGCWLHATAHSADGCDKREDTQGGRSCKELERAVM